MSLRVTERSNGDMRRYGYDVVEKNIFVEGGNPFFGRGVTAL